jgi:hypothetical protein
MAETFPTDWPEQYMRRLKQDEYGIDLLAKYPAVVEPFVPEEVLELLQQQGEA